jgi:hypothetical protein
MARIYILQPTKPREKCHDCGELADIVLVSIVSERSNGYTDEIALCSDCIDKRARDEEPSLPH